MPNIKTTKLERENLEAHVDLCAERYGQLESRLTNLEAKVEHIHSDIVDRQKSLSKVIITTTGTVIAGLVSVVVVILMKMPG